MEKSIPEELLKSYIEAGKESRNLEYKRSESWAINPNFKAGIIKSILAMSNTTDGGTIVLGVELKGNGKYSPDGLKPDDLKCFENEDDVKKCIAEYADPYVDISINKGEYDGKSFVVITVREFEEIPVICRKNGPKNLTQGHIYVRTRRHPESTIVPSQTEMREIIEMAIDKGNKKLKQRGYAISSVFSVEQKFKDQVKDF